MLRFPEDLGLLCCPVCLGHLGIDGKGTELKCTKCEKAYPIVNNKPYFCDVKNDIIPSAGRSAPSDRSSWSKWRQQNYDFCREALKEASKNSLAVDMGAGRGHFQHLFAGFEKYLAVDFYPYPDVDVIADITKRIPFGSDLADLVLLSNVLEHTPEPDLLLSESRRILKPGQGRAIILVPFLIKIHQAPYDFYRYTSHALEHLLNKAGYEKFTVTPLGDILDIHELIQKAAIKDLKKKSAKRRARLELKLISKAQRLFSARLRNMSKKFSFEPDYVQGYGCIASK